MGVHDGHADQAGEPAPEKAPDKQDDRSGLGGKKEKHSPKGKAQKGKSKPHGIKGEEGKNLPKDKAQKGRDKKGGGGEKANTDMQSRPVNAHDDQLQMDNLGSSAAFGV